MRHVILSSILLGITSLSAFAAVDGPATRADGEHRREQLRDYLRDHPEAKERARAWIAAHPEAREKLREKIRERMAQHPDRRGGLPGRGQRDS